MRIENSYIPVRGVGEKTERSIWEAGALTWDDFERDLVGDTTGERIESFIATAEPHLEAGDARFFADCFPSNEQWRLYENFRDDTLFLDIESTGLDFRRNSITTVSVHRDGDTRTFVQGKDLTVDRIQAVLDDAKVLATFNGVQFDVPFLETELGIDVDLPHLDLMYVGRRLGLSGGLKAIERDLGIERAQPDITGREAIRLWREYERGDRGALETLIEYNRADTVNLESLLDIMTTRLHDRIAPTTTA